MKVSILFATFKRNDLLALMLESFVRLNVQDISLEIVAVDNCPEQTAKPLVAQFAKRLPIIYCAESAPGKNAALTTGLKRVSGDLIVFTDDDIEPDSEWLQALVGAAKRHSQHSIFGGRILPKYPENVKATGKGIDFNNEFVRISYGEADWKQPEGPIEAARIWGANMVIRRELFTNGLNFNQDIGPRGNNYVMGSETEFLLRAYALGYQGIYVPDAVVNHNVRHDQLSLNWLSGRAYRLARGRVQMNPQLHYSLWWGVPRFLYKNYVIKTCQHWLSFLYGEKRKFSNRMDLYKIKGEITQYRSIHKQKQN